MAMKRLVDFLVALMCPPAAVAVGARSWNHGALTAGGAITVCAGAAGAWKPGFPHVQVQDND